MKHVNGKFLIVLTEVDDLVYTGSPELVEEFENTLRAKWNIKECGDLKSFMGINIFYDLERGLLTFDVEEKIKNIFRDKDYLQDNKAIPFSNIPMKPDGDKRLMRDSTEIFRKLSDPREYASIIGAMIFISTTCRPDITQAVGRLSRKMHAPDEQSIVQLRTLLGYLKQNSALKLTCYHHNHPIKDQLQAYGEKDSQLFHLMLSKHKPTVIEGSQLFGESDADYASKLEESRKSTSGYIFFFHHNLISWRSKLQPIIATSTHESELIALHIASQEAIWLRNLMAELKSCITGMPLEKILDDPEQIPSKGEQTPKLSPTFILGDNLGSVHTVSNPVSSKQAKHIEIRYHKCREYQEQNRLVIKHIEGKNNVADLFTKPLGPQLFQRYLELMGMKGKKSIFNPELPSFSS